MDGRQKERDEMVLRQLVRRGIADERVLAAMRTVPRELFVSDALRHAAYADAPLAIGLKQTISQPYIVAFMVEALRLKGGEKVLEIGAGSGYAAAVLGEIAAEVMAIERLGPLAEQARANLARAGCSNVTVHHADGSLGWPDGAPYDAILVSAGAPEVPHTLVVQLRPGARMVVPVGHDPGSQKLLRVTRLETGGYETETIADVRFVPLIGREGWDGRDGDT